MSLKTKHKRHWKLARHWVKQIQNWNFICTFPAEYCKISFVLFVTNILVHYSSKQMVKKKLFWINLLNQSSQSIFSRKLACLPACKIFFFFKFFSLFIEISIIGTGVKYANILATKQALFKTNITLKNINNFQFINLLAYCFFGDNLIFFFF